MLSVLCPGCIKGFCVAVMDLVCFCFDLLFQPMQFSTPFSTGLIVAHFLTPLPDMGIPDLLPFTLEGFCLFPPPDSGAIDTQ